MSRPRFIPLLVTVGAIAAVVVGWILYGKTMATRYQGVVKVAEAESDVRMGLQIAYRTGPLVRETYRMEDKNGVSTSRYSVLGRSGITVTVDAQPRETYDVSFLFGKLVQDGVWELRNRPPRGNAAISYTIDVYQLNVGKHGSHAFTFTDPHYWATTGGHQFTIHLDRNKPVPDLLRMSSTTLVEPRYGLVIDDFTAYGSPAFKHDVASARMRAIGRKG